MVITIEPGTCPVFRAIAPPNRYLTATQTITGVYVPSDPAYPKHFHGLGIRIEVSRAGTRMQ